MVALGSCGAAIAAYLSYTRLTDVGIICPTTGCATVQHSTYSEVGGVPVGYLGVLGYSAIALVAALPGAAARAAGAVLTLVAVVFAGYLLFAQLVLIDAVCAWCLASDAVVLSLVVLVVLRLWCGRRSRRESEDPSMEARDP
jgi:uncharacterized membrane protein